jgi:coenzyme F420-reducing hydrogenase beta subunit
MRSTPLVIDVIVKNDLCVGCGICVVQCPSQALRMDWNYLGFLVPVQIGNCDNERDCIDVCPFNPDPKVDVRSEDEISDRFLTQATIKSDKIGTYINLYAGYSLEHRSTSSSGGLATYVSKQLLRQGIVDFVVAVRECNDPHAHFEYGVIKAEDEVVAFSKTRYYPVTLAKAIQKVKELDGYVAVSGIPCFIKALRLAQYKDLTLKAKVLFTIGIFCGGLKSKLYTDFLAASLNVDKLKVISPQYRIKDFNSRASDYSFGFVNADTGNYEMIKMSLLGDMWGTGLFKANACDFCDDVTAELADISLGDAWIEPYDVDGAGTNVIITRTPLADQLINRGIEEGDLIIDRISESIVVQTQRGSFNHRHNGLGFRIDLARRNGIVIPPKRKLNETSFFFKLVQRQRIKLRKESLELFVAPISFSSYVKHINSRRKRLRFITRVYHFYNNRIKKFL